MAVQKNLSRSNGRLKWQIQCRIVRRKIRGIRRNAVALFCASLRHLSGPGKLRLGEMSVIILGFCGQAISGAKLNFLAVVLQVLRVPSF